MFKKQVKEKLYEFLEKSYWATNGVENDDDLAWRRAIRVVGETYMDIADTRNPAKIRVCGYCRGALNVAEFALIAAGIPTIPSPCGKDEFDVGLSHLRGRAIELNLTDERIIAKLDNAIMKLPAAKIENRLDVLAQIATQRIISGLEKERLLNISGQIHPPAGGDWTGIAGSERALPISKWPECKGLLHDLLERLSAELRGTGSVASGASTSNQKVNLIVREVVDDFAFMRRKSGGSKDHIPDFDDVLTKRLCDKIENKFQLAVIESQLPEYKKSLRPDGWYR